MIIQHVRVVLVFFLTTLSIAGSGWAADSTTGPGTTPGPPFAAEDDGADGVPAPADGDESQEDTGIDIEPGSPAAVVQELNASLQKVLEQAEALGYDGRLERLSPILDAAFDFNYMAQKTVGRHWSALSPEEQKRWVDLFADLTKATYAGRFDRFSGQTFELVGQQPSASNTVIVRSKVVSPGEDDVNLSYRMGETAAGWKIIDVYFKGTVSELAMRRADYSSVLKNEGFEALVAQVNDRIAELRAGANP